MLTLTALEQRHLEAQSQAWEVIVTIGTEAATTIELSSGTAAGATSMDIDRVQNVEAVTPLALQLDPIGRKVQRSAMRVTVQDDGVIRDMMQTEALKNATVTISFVPEASRTSVIPLWSGLLEDVIPRAGSMELICSDPISKLEGLRYLDWFAGLHPLEVMKKILEHGDVGWAADAATVGDWDHDTAISHLVVGSLHGWQERGAVLEPPTPAGTEVPNSTTPGPLPAQFSGTYAELLAAMGEGEHAQHEGGIDSQELLDQMALTANGFVWTDETGSIKFKAFDPTAAVDDTWLMSDIVGDVEVLQVYKDMINEVIVEMGHEPYLSRLVYRDTASQADYSAPAGATAIHQHELAMPWSGTPQVIYDNSGAFNAIDNSQTAFSILGQGVAGMCGCRVDVGFREQTPLTDWSTDGPFTQDADALVSASRPAYLQLDSEIIKITAMAVVEEWAAQIADVDAYGADEGTTSAVPRYADVTASTRGHGATSAAAHTSYGAGGRYSGGARIKDITAAYLVASTIVDRCANGLPIIQVRTSLAKYAYEIGDLIALDGDPLFCWWGVDGLSSTNVIKWEIVGKEVDVLGDEPGIRWRLAYAAIATPAWTSTTEEEPLDEVYQSGDAIPVGGTMYRSTTATGPGKAASATVAFNADVEGAVEGFDSTTGKYTAPATGRYDILTGIYISGIDAGAVYTLEIKVAGVVERTVGDYSTAGGDLYLEASLNNHFLAAGEIVEVVLTNGTSNTAGTIQSGSNQTFLTIRRVD